MNWRQYLYSYDDQCDIAVGSNRKEAVEIAVAHFIECAAEAIKRQNCFTVALSGGSTPKAIFSALAASDNRHRVDWRLCRLFWSDERAVPPTHPESNFRMAMESGLASLPIPQEQIFRMQAESEIESNALAYEEILRNELPQGSFDLVMLGMGSDGHTASLFPMTHGLHVNNRLAIANYVPQLEAWRMTLTYECINAAKNIAIYVMGSDKAPMLKRVFSLPRDIDSLPIQNVGLRSHHAVWIVERDAISELSGLSDNRPRNPTL